MSNTSNKNTNIYVLKLAGGRRYVGKTDDPQKRIQAHFDGKGSVWTKKYKPVAIERVISNVSHFEEDKVTKEMMSKYGIDKVRGGSYTSVNLSQGQKKYISKELQNSSDSCFSCGKSGHFSNNCYSSRYNDKDSENQNSDDEFLKSLQQRYAELHKQQAADDDDEEDYDDDEEDEDCDEEDEDCDEEDEDCDEEDEDDFYSDEDY